MFLRNAVAADFQNGATWAQREIEAADLRERAQILSAQAVAQDVPRSDWRSYTDSAFERHHAASPFLILEAGFDFGVICCRTAQRVFQ